MSIFGKIFNAIFHHGASATPQQPAATAAPKPAAPQAAPAGTSAQPQAQAVDVEAVLTQLANAKGGGGNWRESIVDLLKLLDLDSSLDARKELGQELGVHAGADGSAEQNVALIKAVWKKLAENGGKVPASLKD